MLLDRNGQQTTIKSGDFVSIDLGTGTVAFFRGSGKPDIRLWFKHADDKMFLCPWISSAMATNIVFLIAETHDMDYEVIHDGIAERILCRFKNH